MLKVLFTAAVVLAVASVSFAATLPASSIHGNYIEARTADVYTGPCFANGEADQVGTEAVFGWKIDNGDWHGVKLAGLSVVAVIRSAHTLGLSSEPVNPAKAVLIVDSRADAEQRLALQSFARHMGGDLLASVVKVDYVPIELTIQGGNIHGGGARLTAGSLAEIQTRAMTAADHICGNEEVWYPPLTKTEHVMPAYALENTFTGDGLGETWHNRFKRSGFLGTFQVASE
ncbi:conserved exported hypothetical protein [Candidatus Sulfopaludibacter sp. SbA4]|nr:conserved exported hypothetical protein [Candidatus Sulfopaludibacter sp. SbA4]